MTPTVTEPHVALTWSGTAESTPIYGFGADLDADDFGDVLLRGWADNDTDADYLAVVRGADLADHAGIIDIRHIALATWDLPLHSGVYVLGDIDGDGFDDVAFGAPHAVHDRSRRQP
ncbi:MAG: FG-GAP repeat protein [Myxococcales bacterium]|nr:FG-GAP repeat protein [Myxococcales bacterium]